MLNDYNIVVCPARCHLALLFLGCDIPITYDGLYHLFSEFSFAAIAQLLEFSGLHCCLFVKVHIEHSVFVVVAFVSAATLLSYHRSFALSTTFLFF